MKTHTSSQSRIITVWLVLLAFLCCTMVPSIALAEKDMVIATEGDPRDGLDSSGGGSGVIDEGDSPNSINVLDPNVFILQNNLLPFVPNTSFFVLPIWENGQVHFYVVFDQYQNNHWRTIH